MLYDKGEVSVSEVDLNYGEEKETSAAAWWSYVRIKEVKIKSYKVLEEKPIAELRKENIRYGDEWDLNLSLSLGSRFRHTSSTVANYETVTDYITKDAVIKIRCVNNGTNHDIFVDPSSDFNFGEAKQQSAAVWNISVRVKEANVRSFKLLGENIRVVAQTDSQDVGNTSINKIELLVRNREAFGVDYKIERLYYSKDEGNSWVEINEFDVNDDKVNFLMHDEGKYKFKIVDSSGAYGISNKINVYTVFPENTKEHPQEVGLQVAIKDKWKNDDTVKYINTSDGLEVKDIAQVASVYGVSVGDGETVPVPKGFYYVGGNFDNGVIISDNIDDMYEEGIDKTTYAYTTSLVGNQFVWIPCEEDKYVKTTWAKGEGTAFDPYTPQGEGTSVRKYGGFYIARYEAGVPTTITSTEWQAYGSTVYNFAGVPQSKAGIIPWNFVNRYNALESANKMYNTEYVNSGLVTGTQWDVTMNKIIEKTDVTINDINTATWGNFLNNEVSVTGYYTYVDGNNWLPPYEYIEDGKTSAGTKYFLSTGAVEIAEKYHIFDLAGNLFEWTEEMYIGKSRLVVFT